MPETIYYEAIYSLLMILFLLLLIFKGLRGIAIDNYRHRLFQVRDNFFDEALHGNISFSHPAYKYVRNSINHHIRFSHKHSVWLLLHFAAQYFKNKSLIDSEVNAKWEEVTAGLNEDQVEMVRKYNTDASVFLIKHVVFFSPEFIPILILLLVPILVLIAVGYLKKIQKFLINSNSKNIGLQMCDI